MSVTTINLEMDTEQMRKIFGMQDAYIKKLEQDFQVTIVDRNGSIIITGEEENTGKASRVLRQLTALSDRGNDIEEQFLSMLEKNRQKDIFRKTTSIGPHRDDLAFFINNMNATFGSQGQHRSVVLSLKLAEIELMEEITREKPILLLDDVMSELDNYRQLQLLETISNNIQTFITTTTLDHLKELPEELKIFTVQAGHIKTAS